MANGSGKKGGRGPLIFGALAGALIGAAVALVYSPSNGEGNRQRLLSYVKR